MTTEKMHTFCRVCEPACGLVAEVRDGELVKLSPDRDHPVTRGFACNKGIAGVDIHHDPDRLAHPMRRDSDGEYERISWNDAITDVAGKTQALIDRYGPESVGYYVGNPTAFNTLCGPHMLGFFQQLGLRRGFNSGTQDCANKFAGGQAVFGSSTIHPIPDIDNTDFLLVFGCNPRVSHWSFMSIADPIGVLKNARARGAKVYFVNPRRIESVDSGGGDALLIRPDTDVYLLAALIHEIDRIGGFNEDVLRAYGAHVDELRSFVAKYPAERVSGVTGIDVDTIRCIAREFSEARAASVHMSTGVNMGRQGTLCYWLVQMLSFVTGNFDRSGGNVVPVGFYERAKSGRGDYSKSLVDGEFGPTRKGDLPGNLLSHYILDAEKPIRALFVTAGNPVLAIGGEERLREAMEKLELLVVVDLYRNATGEYAHYLLPSTDQFERQDINITGLGVQHEPWVQFAERVVEPRDERREEWWIYGRLAHAMGKRSIFDAVDDPAGNPDEVPSEEILWSRIDHMMATRGISLAEVRAKPQGHVYAEPLARGDFFEHRIQTEDKKIDCCPPAFEGALVRCERLFEEMAEEGAGLLKLISRREHNMHNSWYANLEGMKRAGRDRNYLYMHPNDMAARGVGDGDEIALHNAYGRIAVAVKPDEGLMKGVVALAHGWGNARTSGMRHARQTPGSNPNALLPIGADSYDALSNQAFMTGIPVEVEVL
jgi:anaerobic selenocysteine-containing dehydrogenase